MLPEEGDGQQVQPGEKAECDQDSGKAAGVGADQIRSPGDQHRHREEARAIAPHRRHEGWTRIMPAAREPVDQRGAEVEIMIIAGRRVACDKGVDQRQAMVGNRRDHGGMFDEVEHRQRLVERAGAAGIGIGPCHQHPPRARQRPQPARGRTDRTPRRAPPGDGEREMQQDRDGNAEPADDKRVDRGEDRGTERQRPARIVAEFDPQRSRRQQADEAESGEQQQGQGDERRRAKPQKILDQKRHDVWLFPNCCPALGQHG